MFLGLILAGRCAPTNPSPRAMGPGPSRLPHACLLLQLKDVAAWHLQEKKKLLLSIMEAICLHVHPVTKPQPPHAHTDFPGPGRNNQHMRGKGRTPRLPLDQHQYTHSCYFGNIWVYLTEHFMHSSSTCIATNKGFSNAGMYKYRLSHRDIVIQFKCLELQLLK